MNPLIFLSFAILCILTHLAILPNLYYFCWLSLRLPFNRFVNAHGLVAGENALGACIARILPSNEHFPVKVAGSQRCDDGPSHAVVGQKFSVDFCGLLFKTSLRPFVPPVVMVGHCWDFWSKNFIKSQIARIEGIGI